MFVHSILDSARKNLFLVSEDALLIDVAKLLNAGAESIIAIDAAGVFSGLVTKSDVVRQISECGGATCLVPASVAMTREVVVCGVDDSLQEVARLMKERHLKSLPVLDNLKRPIGLISASTVLRELLGEIKYEEGQLINYVKGVGYR